MGTSLTDLRTVNHDLGAELFKEEQHEVEAESTQAVFVHDHNLFDHAADDSVQKGLKTFALEVEPASDVGYEGVMREGGAQVSLLSFEIGALLRRGDPGVNDALILSRNCSLGFFVADPVFDALQVVESSTVSSPGSYALNGSGICPVSQGRRSD